MIQNNNKKTFKIFLLEQKYIIAYFIISILSFTIFVVLLNGLWFQNVQLTELIDAYKILHNDYLNLLKQVENISSVIVKKDIEIHELNQQLNINLSKEVEDFTIKLTENKTKKFYFALGSYGLLFLTMFITTLYSCV